MTGLQLRMARTALGLTLRQAAELTGFSNETIVRLEAEKRLKDSTHCAVRAAFEAAGIIFIDENGEGLGVRLKKASAATPPEANDTKRGS